MGFYSDFIFACEDEMYQYKVATKLGKVKPEFDEEVLVYFYRLAQGMRKAKIIRMAGAQCQLFVDTPRLEQDAKWLKLPFKDLWIQLDSPFNVVGVLYNSATDSATVGAKYVASIMDNPQCALPVRGVYIQEKTSIEIQNQFDIDTLDGHDLKNICRVFSVNFVAPIPETPFNESSTTLIVMNDGSLVTKKCSDTYRPRQEALLRFVIHTINFLSSPSVKLVPAEPSPELQKARSRKGKEPLPGWYEITYRKHVNDYTKSKVSTVPIWHQSFRYDVRGNFASFTKGVLAGRVIWRPPHQRGLANELYKPKTYRTENIPGVSNEIWKG